MSDSSKNSRSLVGSTLNKEIQYMERLPCEGACGQKRGDTCCILISESRFLSNVHNLYVIQSPAMREEGNISHNGQNMSDFELLYDSNS